MLRLRGLIRWQIEASGDTRPAIKAPSLPYQSGASDVADA
jgi:hypothetical protein